MAVEIGHLAPVAHLPLILGMLRKLEVAQLIDTLIPPNPAHVVSCGRGVEALVLAILDGHHALYKVGCRLDEWGMLPLLQPVLEPASLHDTRLGQVLDALFKANLNQIFSQVALRALDTYSGGDAMDSSRYDDNRPLWRLCRGSRGPAGASPHLWPWQRRPGDLKQVLLRGS